MADTLTTTTTVSTIPSGTVIATDDAGAGGHVQIVKLAISTDGSATAIPAEATNGLDVDVTRVIPGTTATALGKAEDAAHSSGDTGVMALGVRQDADAALGADGDYAPFQVDANGYLKVNIKAGAGTGGTSMTDDAAFTPGSTGINPIGAMFDDVAPDSVNEGDGGVVRMSANRNLYATLRDAAGNERGMNIDANGAIAIGSVTPGVGALNLGKANDDPFAGGDVGVQALGVRQNANSAIGADGDYSPFQLDANGYVKVNALTVASHAVTNAGTFAVQVDGSALTALQLIDDPVLADDAAFTPATSKVMMSGFQADESSTDSVDEGDAGAARMTLDRKLIITPQPHTAGGLSIFRSIDLDEGTLEIVKASPGQVYGMWATNTATATRWIKFYDATSGTAGTGTPVITLGIPGNSSDDIAGNFGPGGMGIAFATGICVGATTGVADADTGAPGANDVIVNIFYK